MWVVTLNATVTWQTVVPSIIALYEPIPSTNYLRDAFLICKMLDDFAGPCANGLTTRLTHQSMPCGANNPLECYFQTIPIEPYNLEMGCCLRASIDQYYWGPRPESYVNSAPFRLVFPLIPGHLWGEANGPYWLDPHPSTTIKICAGTSNQGAGKNLTQLMINMDNYYTGYLKNVILKRCQFNSTGVPQIVSQQASNSFSNWFKPTFNTSQQVNITVQFRCEVRHGNSTYFAEPKNFTLEILNETICSQFVYLKPQGEMHYTMDPIQNFMIQTPRSEIVVNTIGLIPCPYLEKVIVFSANDTVVDQFQYNISDEGILTSGYIPKTVKFCENMVQWRFKVPAPAPAMTEYIRGTSVKLTFCTNKWTYYQTVFNHPVVFEYNMNYGGSCHPDIVLPTHFYQECSRCPYQYFTIHTAASDSAPYHPDLHRSGSTVCVNNYRLTQNITYALKLYFQGGFTMWWQGVGNSTLFTFKNLCPLRLQDISIYQGIGMNTYQAFEAGDPNLFFALPYYHNDAYGCPISINITTSYTAVTTKTTGWMREPELQPGDQIYYIRPQNASLEIKHVFFVRIHVWVSVMQYFGPFTLDVGCTDSEILFDIHPDYYELHVGVDPVLKTLNYTIPPIRPTNKTYCFPRVITINQIVADPPAETADLIKLYPGCKQPCYDLLIDLSGQTNLTKGAAQKITLQIKVQVSPQEFKIATKNLNIIACQVASTKVYPVYEFVYDSSVQRVPILDGEKPTFKLPWYDVSNQDCPIQKHEISYRPSFGDDTNKTELIMEPIRKNWFRIVPKEINLPKIYEFYIKVTALGNSTVTDTFIFIVGCTNNVTFTPHPNFTTAMKEMPPGNFYGENYLILMPNISILYPYCYFTEIKLINQTQKGVPKPNQVRIKQGCNQPCYEVEFVNSLPLSNITFQVEFIINQWSKFTSEPVNIEFTDCLPKTAKVSITKPDYYYEITQFDYSHNAIDFGSISCSYSPCCNLLEYGATLNDTAPLFKFNMLTTSFAGGKLRISFPIEKQRQFYIYIFADNKYGAVVVSELITINIIFRPQFNLAFSDPDLYLKKLAPAENQTEVAPKEEVTVVQKEVIESVETLLADLPPNLKFLESLMKGLPAPVKQAFKKRLSNSMGLPVDTTKFNCRIFDFNKLGILSILFDTDMLDQNAGIRLDQINDDILRLDLILSEESLETLETFSPEEKVNVLSLEWEAVSFIKNRLDLKVTFTQPLFFSQGKAKDVIQVTIEDLIYFRADTPFKKLSAMSSVNLFEIPTLMIDDAAGKTLLTSVQLISGGGQPGEFQATQTLMNVGIAMTLSQIISTFGAVQIICFQTLMNLKQPGNVKLLHQVFITVLNAEVIDPEWTTKLIFNFDIDQVYAEEMVKARISMMLQPQIYEAGFDTYNPILNCGGLYVFICIFIAFMLGLLILMILINVCVKCGALISNSQKFEGGSEDDEDKDTSICCMQTQVCVLTIIVKVMRSFNNLYFNPILILIQESVFQLTISALLYFFQPHAILELQKLVNYPSFVASYTFAGFCMFLVAFYFLVCILIMYLGKKSLESKGVIARIGMVYEDLKLDRLSLLYLFVFLLRRMLIVYLALFLSQIVGMQILIQLYVNLFALIFIGAVRPFKTRRKNIEELQNEALIYLLTIILTIFSDFCPLAESRYNVGWGYILINIVNLLHKFGGVFLKVLRYLKLRVKACRHRSQLMKNKQPIEKTTITTKKQKNDPKPTAARKKKQLPKEPEIAKEQAQDIYQMPIPRKQESKSIAVELNILEIEDQNEISFDMYPKLKIQKARFTEVSQIKCPDTAKCNPNKQLIEEYEAKYLSVLRKAHGEYRRTLKAQVAREIILHFKDKNAVLEQLINNQLLDLEKAQVFYKYLAVRRIEFKLSQQIAKTENNGGVATKVNAFFDSWRNLDEIQNRTLQDCPTDAQKAVQWDFIQRNYIQKRITGLPICREHVQYFENIQPHWLFSIHYSQDHLDAFSRDSFTLSFIDFQKIQRRRSIKCQLLLSQVTELGKATSAQRKIRLEKVIEDAEKPPRDVVETVYTYLSATMELISAAQSTKTLAQTVSFNVFQEIWSKVVSVRNPVIIFEAK